MGGIPSTEQIKYHSCSRVYVISRPGILLKGHRDTESIMLFPAIEAFVGLAVEVSFIVTFTQRFFAR